MSPCEPDDLLRPGQHVVLDWYALMDILIWGGGCRWA